MASMNCCSKVAFVASVASKRLRSSRTRSRARCTTCRHAASLRSITGGNLAIADVEHIVQQEGGSLLGREPLEQRKEGNGQIGSQIEVSIGRSLRDDRLRQPRTDVRLALGLEPPQPIDCQPAGRCHEPRFGALDAAGRHLVPADVGFLHDVLGVGARAEHAVGETEEPAAQSLERGHGGPGRSHTLILQYEDGWRARL